jgi:hypothetical protein
MPNDETLSLINKLTLRTKREARRLSSRLERGDITQGEWEEAMSALLVSSHIVSASAGRGGRQAMTGKDWAKVERKVNWQEGFLPKFGRAIVAGAVVGAAMLHRAGLYADPVYVSYQAANIAAHVDDEDEWYAERELNAQESCDDCIALADLGFIPVDEVTEIGEDTQCGNFCKCTLNFKRKSEL